MSETTPWILLRGLTRDTRHWGPFVPELQRAFEQAAVVPLDLPGNGSLNRERTPWTVEGIAAHCRDQLARRGLAPPYRLLALSLGGMVAVAWMHCHPADIEAAVLINTSLRPHCPLHWRMRPRAWPTLLEQLLLWPSAERAERAILRLTGHAPQPPELLSDWANWRRSHPVSRGNALRQLAAAARFRAPATPPQPPMLLLSGGRDALVDPRCSERLAALWRCRHERHEQAGHDLTLDEPAWVAGRVRRWIDTIGRDKHAAAAATAED